MDTVIVHLAELELVLGWLIGFEPVVVEPGEGLGHGGVGSFAHARGSRGCVRDSSLRRALARERGRKKESKTGRKTVSQSEVSEGCIVIWCGDPRGDQ